MKKEEWRSVVGYEGIYEVSNLGQYRSLDRYVVYKSGIKYFKKGGLRSLKNNKDGYKYTSLSKGGSKKTISIHRLVAFAFLGDPGAGYEVNHKNGVKTDNSLDNLEWCTPEENQKHSREVLGNKKPCYNLTDTELRYVLDNYIPGRKGSLTAVSLYLSIPTYLILSNLKRLDLLDSLKERTKTSKRYSYDTSKNKYKVYILKNGKPVHVCFKKTEQEAIDLIKMMETS